VEVYADRLLGSPSEREIVHPKKIKHEQTKTRTKDATSPSQPVKPKEVHGPVCLTLCFGVHLGKILLLFVIFALLASRWEERRF
jgi:hypothetical protein